MKPKAWYEKLFENYAQKYDQETFTQGTVGECDFIEKELNFDKTRKILDVGCGTGRHAVELARRGYSVAGIDISEAMLKKAREKAQAAGVEINFIKADARALPFQNEFDLAIMLCEGAFPLMETDEMNFEILKSVTPALKPGAKLIFTTLNGLFPLFHSVKDFLKANQGKNRIEYEGHVFDLMTFRDYSRIILEGDDGQPIELETNERFYVPSEITWLLKSLGYSKVEIFGARLGAYSRDDSLTSEDFEMLVIAEKTI
ncbi:MAG: class I SAM-dependent methyltransferase [Candidatus Saccharicenans sp.]|uniref:class I SAM-dependent methyltransferase n=1 Tax=Candidatus Saccharicenans sp. TaxID=2819258 RepID=UPI00404AC072